MNRILSPAAPVAGLLVLLLALSGCKSVDTVERINPEAIPDPVADERIVTDPTLRRHITVVEVNRATVSGDLTRVQVRLQNNLRRDRTVQYRFEWYDAEDMFVDSPTSVWRVRTLKGGETIALSDVAPNPRAVDFVLKLQRN